MSNSIIRDIDLIWTTTKVCGFDCEFCCVNARHVSRQGKQIVIRCPASGAAETIGFQQNAGNAFAQAVRYLQETNQELDWTGRMRVLEHLRGYRVKLDITGGDCLLDPSIYQLVREAARRLGKDNVTLTATGTGQRDPRDLLGHVAEVNITVDSPTHSQQAGVRPEGYARANLRWAGACVRAGLPVRAECPLTSTNCHPQIIETIYRQLRDVGVQTFLLMRLFAVGRGARNLSAVPTPADYRKAIETARKLEKALGVPRVKVQCALRSLEHPGAHTNHCDAVVKSFGIMADGTLLGSPWALDFYGRPLSDEWVLGDLSVQPLADILASEKAKSFLARSNENLHHCKIYAFQQSSLSSVADRIYDRADEVAIAANVNLSNEMAIA